MDNGFPSKISFFDQTGFQLFNIFNVFGVEISDTETELTFPLRSLRYAEKYSYYEPYFKLVLSSCKRLLK